MTPFYQDEAVTVVAADCLAALPNLEDASVDAVVTDPPYGLGFMGKDWDSPGGTGDFPMRRFDAINTVNTGASRQGGRQRSCVDFTRRQARDARSYQEWCERWAAECLRVLKPGGHMLAFGGTRTAHRLAAGIEDAGFEIRDTIAWLYGSGFPKSRNLDGDWRGWGTALKPANEPIIVARKSLTGPVAANVQAHGVGVLNIDGCRTATTDSLSGGAATKGSASHSDGWDRPWKNDPDATAAHAARVTANVVRAEELGRWPSNVCLDTDTAAELDRQSGVLHPNGARSLAEPNRDGTSQVPNGSKLSTSAFFDRGGASRFFPTFRYEPKAPTCERPTVDGVMHPTVKPLDLIRWLTRLVTPPGGLVLDPFLGSGTTAEACLIEGLRCIGIEREPDYLPLITARLAKPLQPDIFGGAA